MPIRKHLSSADPVTPSLHPDTHATVAALDFSAIWAGLRRRDCRHHGPIQDRGNLSKGWAWTQDDILRICSVWIDKTWDDIYYIYDPIKRLVWYYLIVTICCEYSRSFTLIGATTSNTLNTEPIRWKKIASVTRDRRRFTTNPLNEDHTHRIKPTYHKARGEKHDRRFTQCMTWGTKEHGIYWSRPSMYGSWCLVSIIHVQFELVKLNSQYIQIRNYYWKSVLLSKIAHDYVVYQHPLMKHT